MYRSLGYHRREHQELHVAVFRPHLTRCDVQKNIITEHMEGIGSGDRLQDHGTGQRSFSFRASPRGVK